MCYAVAENFSALHFYPKTLIDTEIKLGRLIDSAKEISNYHNVAVEWLLLEACSQFCTEKQEKWSN